MLGDEECRFVVGGQDHRWSADGSRDGNHAIEQILLALEARGRSDDVTGQVAGDRSGGMRVLGDRVYGNADPAEAPDRAHRSVVAHVAAHLQDEQRD